MRFIGLLFAAALIASAQNPSYPPAVSGGGVGASSASKGFTALLCAGLCVANESTNWKWEPLTAQTVTSCTIDAAVYPTGADLIVDIRKNPTTSDGGDTWSGGTSIFTSTLPKLTAGSSSAATQSGMSAAAALSVGDYLVAWVTQIGSTIAGKRVTLTCAIS